MRSKSIPGLGDTPYAVAAIGGTYEASGLIAHSFDGTAVTKPLLHEKKRIVSR